MAGMKSWSTTAGNNVLANTGFTMDEGMAPSAVNDSVRQLMADVRTEFYKGADIASAATVDLSASTGSYVQISGTVTITALGTVDKGIIRYLEFQGALTLTHNATSLILPTAANITTVAGDVAQFISEGSGNWRCFNYLRGTGAPLRMTQLTAALGSPVSLSNTANSFDGPSVAQGTVGTWFCSGQVACQNSDAAANPRFFVKLWDGTTVIAAGIHQGAAVQTGIWTVSLSGFITAPAGNVRISVRSVTTVTASIESNATGDTNSSVITAIRIA